MRYFVILVIIIGCSKLSLAQKEWLGSKKINSTIYSDPTEIQLFGSISQFKESSEGTSTPYLPFAFGVEKSILSKKTETRNWELLAGFVSFTQFEWKELNGKMQRNLLNTDYKAAITYHFEKNKSIYRIRLYHVSSHLGDDYILRNFINKYTENKVNYEQIEFHTIREIRPKLKAVAGLGIVARPNALRKPISLSAGLEYNKFDKQKSGWGYSIGFNAKAMQEHDFNPATKVLIGPTYFNKELDPALRFALEFFNGNLPYSQFEGNRVYWFGLGMYVSI